MTEASDEKEEARVRRRRWFAWVWVVPIASAAIVVWLGFRTIHERGPAITISFRNAQGLQAGQTRVQHRNAEVGTVDSLDLTPDMSRVIIHARMHRIVEPYLNENTRFYIVAPRVGAGGISGLTTIISGAYIEMYPGKGGQPKRDFVGLEDPPVLPPDTEGREFALRAFDLGSITPGSPVSYHGVSVGEVVGYTLDHDGQHVNLTAFIRSPHDRLVHPETRFWNAGGVDVSIGASGLRFRANSWQQLLTGGIAFATPDEVLKRRPSEAGATFYLYDNRRSAMREPHGPQLVYVADFTGNIRGVEPGTPVELQGMEVGEVKETHLRYDSRRRTLLTRLILSIDPDKVQILDLPVPAGGDAPAAAEKYIEMLVAQGLRAQVSEVSLLTGFKFISLEMAAGSPPGHLQRAGQYARIPTTHAGDLTAVLQSAQSVLRNIDRATGGPELSHALKSLDDTLTRLDQVTRDVEPDLKALVRSLRETAAAAQGTLNAVQGMVGKNAPTDTDLPRLMRELTQAARSIRALADYLDRHPEALLRGRRGEQQ